MSEPDWLPIRPYLSDPSVDGKPPHFLAVDHLDDAEEYVPVFPEGSSAPPAPEDCRSFWDHGEAIDVQVGASLGIGSVLDLSTTIRTGLVEHTVMYYSQVGSGRGPVYGTRWGAGFRLVLHFTKFDTSTEVNAGVVAAAAEVGVTSAHFEIEGYGFFFPELLQHFPLPGRFDHDAWTRFRAAVQVFRERYAENANREEFDPQPLWVKMSRPSTPDALLESRAVLWAAQQIVADNELARAIAAAPTHGYDPALVRVAYRTIAGIVDPNENIRLRHRQAARTWTDA